MMMKNGHKYYFMKLVALLPVQVGYGKNSNCGAALVVRCMVG
ncbi:hypothetical protein [Peribacillus sp. R9-11]|nr:hypothetical protein [Peribacillus sp. R9-11]WMX56430.1 hypothetical protein RE409_04115 [Peribacillus sp. R9-11]